MSPPGESSRPTSTVLGIKFKRKRLKRVANAFDFSTLPFQPLIMLRTRRVLGPIDGNVDKRKQLSAYERGRIVGANLCGTRPAHIARILNLPDSTVRTTIRNAPLRNEGETRPRTGRPVTYSDREVRRTVRHVRQYPKATYEEIRRNLDYKYCNKTIRAMLEPSGIAHWICKRRPCLTEEVAKLRFEWCKLRKDWTFEDFAKHMWSDECSAERGKGGGREWAFCTAAERLSPQNVTTYKKSKDISVMVWGCFWYKDGVIKRSGLYILERDFESKKHGYSANSYLAVLEDQIPSCWEPGLVFMQDNAPIHKSRKVMDWFRDHAIPVIDWPPYSPDLNPIEHIWYHLKKKVLELHPEIETMGGGESALQALERALIEAWELLPDEIFLGCLRSMENRRDAVIAAKGWHTKY